MKSQDERKKEAIFEATVKPAAPDDTDLAVDWRQHLFDEQYYSVAKDTDD